MHGNGLPISIWRREIQSDWQLSAGGRQGLQPGRGGGSNGVLAVAEDPHKQGGHQARGAHSYRVAVSRRSYALDLAKGNTITQSIGASRILGVVRTIRGAGGGTAGEGQSRQISRARQGPSRCSRFPAILSPVALQHSTVACSA